MKDSSLAVVFDWDNTLVDTQDNIFNAIKHTINSMGYSNKAASGYEDLLCFQHFDKLTDFIIKYLEDR